MAALVQHLGTGRRKTAVARIFLRSGKGQITVNGRTFENYFANEAARAMVRQPLLATEMADKFDILILADGGGPTGQAGAARLGIARALIEFNSELRGEAEGTRIAHARPARARAQEVRAEGRAQAVPVLETLARACRAARLGSVRALHGSISNRRTQIPLWAVCAGAIGSKP